MPEISAYQQGAPCWLDLWTPDREKSMAFYGSVFGWEFRVGTAEQHFFTEAAVGGRVVAGLVSPPGATDMVWVTYLAADDLDAVLAKVVAQEGRSLTGAMAVPGTESRIALAVEPTGALFGIVETRAGGGSEVVNEPGAPVWHELMSPDPARAREFHAAVFGVEFSDPVAEGFDYTTIRVGGRDVGGIGPADEGRPAAWREYFGTADTDAAAERVRSAGGSVLRDPLDTPYGRVAVCADPHGSVFQLMSTAG